MFLIVYKSDCIANSIFLSAWFFLCLSSYNDDFDDIDDYDVKDDRIDGKDLASDRALLVSLSPVVLVNYSHPSLLSSFEGGL